MMKIHCCTITAYNLLFNQHYSGKHLQVMVCIIQQIVVCTVGRAEVRLALPLLDLPTLSYFVQLSALNWPYIKKKLYQF